MTTFIKFVGYLNFAKTSINVDIIEITGFYKYMFEVNSCYLVFKVTDFANLTVT